jgi:hypothetical protein
MEPEVLWIHRDLWQFFEALEKIRRGQPGERFMITAPDRLITFEVIENREIK